MRSPLVPDLPPDLIQPVTNIVATPPPSRKWARNDDDLVTYLLTINLNGHAPEAVGGALFVFGLIPHFGLSLQTKYPAF